MEELFSACSEEDVEESYVKIAHQPYVYGCFHNKKLASVGSGFKFAGFMDLGIITHPDHRGKGLGKTIVSTISQKIISDNYTCMYRSNENNHGSMGTARSVGFKKFFNQDSLKFINKQNE
ncbi:MAG: GNAT family N-acetyltransferase [Candidatus Hodarchaeales archaeon]|jgi:GNAT superfamily N-acetyltransferase